MPQREWSIQVSDQRAVRRLQVALSIFESDQADKRPINYSPAFSVDRFAGLRVEVFSDEHPPPHFRVSCNGETANYKISDCAQLNGGLVRYYGVIKAWHAENKPKLIETWNERRPTDCPVGAYRD
jgi:type I restriction enzyme, R subunit